MWRQTFLVSASAARTILRESHEVVDAGLLPQVKPLAPREHITSTGWRIIGAWEPSLAPAPIEAGRDEDVLYTVRISLRPRLGTGSALEPLLHVLREAIAEHWPDAPPLTITQPVNRPPERFHGLRWTPTTGDGLWRGELLWRHPHPESSGAPCTTHILLRETSTFTTMALRVTADNGIDSVKGIIGAGLARPAFLDRLHQRVRVLFNNIECRPLPLTHADVPLFVRNVLLGERIEPVIVLSPLEAGGFAVEPDELSLEMLGLAHVYVMDRQQTSYALSDAVGDKRLSCYWGALRVYMPSFSCADRPDEHPLLQHERAGDPIDRARLIGMLSRYAQRWVSDFQVAPAPAAPRTIVAGKTLTTSNGVMRSSSPASSSAAAPEVDATAGTRDVQANGAGETQPLSSVDVAHAEVAPTPSAAPADNAAFAAPLLEAIARMNEHAVNTTAVFSAIVERMDARLGQMSDVLASLAEVNRTLVDEIVRLRAVSPARAGGGNVVDRRMQSLEQSVKSILGIVRAPSSPELASERATDGAYPDDADDDEEGPDLVEIVRRAADAHVETLLILESAEQAAAESPYVEGERLAQTLDVMAGVAARRRSGALGQSLREAFRDAGIEYRGGIAPSTSEKMRRQYEGRGADGAVYECHEHIVLGSGYDPRFCLRIYFTSRAPMEPRFVIGHIGRHHDVRTTT